jgi:uncharacterized membrane protein YkvA (DUF1232 family)
MVVQLDWYRSFRKKSIAWLDSGAYKLGEYVMFLPDLVYFLTSILLHPKVDTGKKVLTVAMVVYYISPIDFLPEAFLGLLGLFDDAVVIIFVLNKLFNKLPQTTTLSSWPGSRRVFYSLQQNLLKIDGYIGSGLISKITGLFK